MLLWSLLELLVDFSELYSLDSWWYSWTITLLTLHFLDFNSFMFEYILETRNHCWLILVFFKWYTLRFCLLSYLRILPTNLISIGAFIDPSIVQNIGMNEVQSKLKYLSYYMKIGRLWRTLLPQMSQKSATKCIFGRICSGHRAATLIIGY